MITKIIFPIAVSIIFCFNASGQALLPGDKLPEILLTNVLNKEEGKLNINEYKGKLLILDFWATNCTGCLKKIPLINSLQNEYNDKVQFILVNTQSKDST